MWVKVDEKTEDGEVQCLVQVSTLPVAVCYAVGPDIEKARVEAARYGIGTGWYPTCLIISIFVCVCAGGVLRFRI